MRCIFGLLIWSLCVRFWAYPSFPPPGPSHASPPPPRFFVRTYCGEQTCAFPLRCFFFFYTPVSSFSCSPLSSFFSLCGALLVLSSLLSLSSFP